MSAIKEAKTPQPSPHRIVRYRDLIPCRNAFIDTRTPGSDQKENFTIIGPGVSESPDQHVHIAEPHGFNIGGARQPPGCLNSQHSHDTAEVFYVHSGTWRFMSGENADDGEVFLKPGDLISLPTKLFRGFENVGDGPGFLFAILGGDDPGRVLWAPQVFEMAKEYGLVLLENGSLVDLTAGQQMPASTAPMPQTTPQQVAALDRATSADLETLVIRSTDECADMACPKGITARPLVGCDPLGWDHGFTITELRFSEGSTLSTDGLDVPEVWFVQEGQAIVSAEGPCEELDCGPGDTISLRQNEARSLTASSEVTLLAIRGGDDQRTYCGGLA